MQLLTAHDLINAAIMAAKAFFEMKGLISADALRLVLLPFSEFSVANCLVAFGWMIFFWRNKGWIFSGLSHMFHVFEWVVVIIRRA